MDFQAQTQFASQLVNLFHPLVEVTLFDEKGSFKEVFNPFSTLKEDQLVDLKKFQAHSTFEELLFTGRNVRSLIYPFYKSSKIAGYMRLRYDLSSFKNLQEQLHFLIGPEKIAAQQSKTLPWKESIDQNIHSYLGEKKITLQALSTKQKRELISKLQLTGLLDFKESTSYVASKLQISRATVYNYLKTASDLKKIHVHQVDAFTNKKFGGNPAGVVLDADCLDEQTMRKIARELNLSETSFVLKSKKADFQLRYFTPTGHEIMFCGHSTVGALYMIAKEKRFGITTGKHSFQVQTLCGILKMEIMVNDKEEIQIAYDAPTINLKQTKITHQEIAEAAECDLKLIDESFPVMFEATNRDLYFVVRSLEDLKKFESNSKTLAQFCKQHDIVVVCAMTQEAFDKKNQFHMRCFAPMVGVAEDPFTGSVLGGLAAYVDTFKLLPKGVQSFNVEQGHFIDRPGIVKVDFTKKGEKYHAKVFAQAVHCFSTEMNL